MPDVQGGRWTAVAAGALVVAGLVAGCSDDPDDSMRASQAASTVPPPTAPLVTVAQSDESFPSNGEVAPVLALDNNFLPGALTVVAGTEVVFENNGRNDHDVIPVGDPDTQAWGVQADEFAPKDTYAHVFAQPGTYAYYCSIHGTETAGMVGTIVVTAP